VVDDPIRVTVPSDDEFVSALGQAKASPSPSDDEFEHALHQAVSDPINSRPKRAEDLPSQADFDASHRAAATDLQRQVNPPGPSMSPAPAPSFWERAKRVMLGDPQGAAGHTDTPLGRAFGISYEAPTEPHTPTTEPGAAGPKFTALSPGEPTSVLGGVGKGALQFADEMTTAPSLLMMGALGGAGALGQVSKYLPRAVSGVFSEEMLRSAAQKVPEVADALRKKDWPRAAQAITNAGLTAGLGVAAGAHAVKGEAPVAETDRGSRSDSGTPPKSPPATD
jgi:hypothetical protein